MEFAVQKAKRRQLKWLLPSISCMNHMSEIKILIASFAHEHNLAIGVCSYLVPNIKGQGVQFSGIFVKPNPNIHQSKLSMTTYSLSSNRAISLTGIIYTVTLHTILVLEVSFQQDSISTTNSTICPMIVYVTCNQYIWWQTWTWGREYKYVTVVQQPYTI